MPLHFSAVTTSRAVRCFSVDLEVLRRRPKCKFAPSARVSPQWRLARARRCRSGHNTSSCAGVEGEGLWQYGVSTVRRQLFHCAGRFLELPFFTIPFLCVSSFPCHSLLLLGCCSNDIVFAAAPSRSSFLPSLGCPPLYHPSSPVRSP